MACSLPVSLTEWSLSPQKDACSVLIVKKEMTVPVHTLIETSFLTHSSSLVRVMVEPVRQALNGTLLQDTLTNSDIGAYGIYFLPRVR